MRSRSRELKAIGLVEIPGRGYENGAVFVSEEQIKGLEELQWEALVNEAENAVETEKLRQAEKRIYQTIATDLIRIGFSELPSGSYSAYGISFSAEEITKCSEDGWLQKISNAEQVINAKKKEEEKRIEILNSRKAKIAPYFEQWKGCNDQQLADYTDSDFEAIFEARKSEAEEAERKRVELKNKQEEDNRKAELQRQGDKAMWDDFVNRVNSVSVPEFISEKYIKLANIAKNSLSSISAARS